MASKTGINISGHYVVLIISMRFHICILDSKKMKGRTESYFTTIGHGVLISDYGEFIPTAVSSNGIEINSNIRPNPPKN